MTRPRRAQRPVAPPLACPASVPPGVVYVHVHSPSRDDLGRVQYCTSWHEDVRWRGGGMMAGQVSFADERTHVQQWRDKGMRVQYWPSLQPVPQP